MRYYGTTTYIYIKGLESIKSKKLVLRAKKGRLVSYKGNREGLHQSLTQYWRYFSVPSYKLGLIKESPPRIVNLNIDEFNM